MKALENFDWFFSWTLKFYYFLRIIIKAHENALNLKSGLSKLWISKIGWFSWNPMEKTWISHLNWEKKKRELWKCDCGRKAIEKTLNLKSEIEKNCNFKSSIFFVKSYESNKKITWISHLNWEKSGLWKSTSFCLRKLNLKSELGKEGISKVKYFLTKTYKSARKSIES